jgi:hypothetical protein
MTLGNMHTGYEVYSPEDTLLPESSGQRMFDSLEARSPGKYKKFLKQMQKLRRILPLVMVPNMNVRHKILVAVYKVMRFLDDICDGDTPLHIEPIDRLAYLEAKCSTLELS